MGGEGLVTKTARPGRARLGMTLEPLLGFTSLCGIHHRKSFPHVLGPHDDSLQIRSNDLYQTEDGFRPLCTRNNRNTGRFVPGRIERQVDLGCSPSSRGSLFSSLLLSILELSDTQLYEPWIRALLGTTSRFCKVVVLKLRAVPICTAFHVRGRAM